MSLQVVLWRSNPLVRAETSPSKEIASPPSAARKDTKNQVSLLIRATEHFTYAWCYLVYFVHKLFYFPVTQRNCQKKQFAGGGAENATHCNILLLFAPYSAPELDHVKAKNLSEK
jgi:hypothetical protein